MRHFLSRLHADSQDENYPMVSSKRAANGEGVRTPCSQPWARMVQAPTTFANAD
jgi:hypothetical protein